MSKNAAATDAKPHKMTKAEFLATLDEVNATLKRQIEEMQKNQKEIEANRNKIDELAAKTRAAIERL